MDGVRPVEWLAARLEARTERLQDLLDAGVLAGYTKTEIRDAGLALRVTMKVSDSGTLWSLPANIIDRIPPPEPTVPSKALKRADRIPDSDSLPTAPKKRSAQEAVQKAREMLRKRSPSAARYLLEMMNTMMEDAEPCPACKRGMPRDEERRLKAILAVLDRSDVGPSKAGGGGDAGPDGPIFVFPPGTQMAVVAPPVAAPVETGIARALEPRLKLTRGDRLESGAAGAAGAVGPIGDSDA